MPHKALEIIGLDYKYPMGLEIFEGAELSIEEGKFFVLLGKNGTGKSTLINLILGFRTPLKGRIELLGNLANADNLAAKENMFFMSHSLEHDPNSSIDFILKTTRILYPNYCEKKEQELLELFELSRDQYIYQLSLGQKVRVQIIAGLASNTPFLLIDEITAVLDPHARKDFTDLLVRESRSGRSILMATNIPDDSKLQADKVICIKNKKVVDYEAA